MEATITEFEAKLPKLYRYVTAEGQTIKAKGVPKQAREAFFAGTTARYRKPLRMREAARRKADANVWIQTQKRLQSRYDKRIVRRGGGTDPLVVG